MPSTVAPVVLLVEDNDDTRELFATVLGWSGFEVLQAADGYEALDLLARHSPNAVVTDIAMPGMDGLQLCRHLRSRPETREVPIVVVTGQSMAARPSPAAAAGANLVLIKPCPPDEIAGAVQNLLERSAEAQRRAVRICADVAAARTHASVLREEARRLREDRRKTKVPLTRGDEVSRDQEGTPNRHDRRSTRDREGPNPPAVDRDKRNK